MKRDETPLLIEPTPLLDTFSTGMTPVEIRHGIARLTFFAERTCQEFYADGASKIDHVVCGRVVIPIEQIPGIIRQLTEAMERHAGEPVGTHPESLAGLETHGNA